MSQAAIDATTWKDDEARQEPMLFTVMEAAQRLRIGRSLMYELLAAGDIPSIRIGRLRRVLRVALDDYVARGQD